jgi:hypothetical protein
MHRSGWFFMSPPVRLDDLDADRRCFEVLRIGSFYFLLFDIVKLIVGDNSQQSLSGERMDSPGVFATVDFHGARYPDIRTVNGVADDTDLRFALDRQRKRK